MPRVRGSGKGETARYNIRLDDDTAQFYKSKANQQGVSLSEYLRRTLVQGIIADNVLEIEQRLRSAAAVPAAAPSGQKLPDEVVQSIFNCEALLTAIVQARDIQETYRAQDRAKLKLQKLKEAVHDGA